MFHRLNPAFNKEVFVDFMGAQIKTLSFLAYIIRIYQEEVGRHSGSMAEGMLGMLQLCPMEVTHLRKDLFIAARHILATELRISKLRIIFICLIELFVFFSVNNFPLITGLGSFYNEQDAFPDCG